MRVPGTALLTIAGAAALWALPLQHVPPEPLRGAQASSPTQAFSPALLTRLKAEDLARQSGDAAAVSQASMRLVAQALADLADLRTAERSWPQAATLYNQALQLEPSLTTRRKLAALPPEATASSPADFAAEPDPETLARAHLSGQARQRMRARGEQLRRVLADGYNDWGSAEARRGDLARALMLFQQGERWAPSSLQIKRNAGAAAFGLGDYAEAARALEPVLAADSADASARMMMAMSLFSLGRFSEADEAFAHIPDAAIQDSRAAYAWAYSLAHTNQQQKANAIVDQLVTRPLPADVLSLVCHIYTDAENYEHAASCFRKVYQEDPSMQKAHYEVGAALIHLDRPAEAIPEFEDELKVSPNNPNVQFNLAYALLRVSRKSEAEALLRKVVAEAPQHAQAQYELGKLLLEEGQTGEAIEHLKVAEQVDPSPDYIHYQLQVAYRRAGRTAEADRELKAYREIKEKRRQLAPPSGMGSAQHGG